MNPLFVTFMLGLVCIAFAALNTYVAVVANKQDKDKATAALYAALVVILCCIIIRM